MKINRKEILRLEYADKRALYSDAHIMDASKKIADLFFNTDLFSLTKISSVHIFLPIKNKKEIDTYFIFNRLQEEYPHVKLVLSKSNFENFTMDLIEYTTHQVLLENKYGIPEPVSGKPFPVEKVDLVVVPLLVVDQKGNRIGYGKGFYDRLLAKCRLDCLKIGLSIEEPIVEITPDSQDIALDYLVTPNKIYVF